MHLSAELLALDSSPPGTSQFSPSPRRRRPPGPTGGSAWLGHERDAAALEHLEVPLDAVAAGVLAAPPFFRRSGSGGPVSGNAPPAPRWACRGCSVGRRTSPAASEEVVSPAQLRSSESFSFHSSNTSALARAHRFGAPGLPTVCGSRARLGRTGERVPPRRARRGRAGIHTAHWSSQVLRPQLLRLRAADLHVGSHPMISTSSGSHPSMPSALMTASLAQNRAAKCSSGRS